MPIVRINVPQTFALDGATPLNLAQATVRSDRSIGVVIIDVDPAALGFGVFDPRELDIFAGSSVLIMQHITVQSAGGDHADGSAVGVVGTQGGVISYLPKRQLINFGQDPGDDIESGIVTEGICFPIPVGHRIYFDTQADGPAPGPHMIQISLLPQRGLIQSCRPPIVAESAP